MQIFLHVPDNIAQGVTFAKEDWLREIAISLFEQEVVTLTMASQIAGLHPMEFQKFMGGRGICMHYDLPEFEADLQNLRDRGWL